MKDIRAALFSSTSRVRIGTSGYSYKRFALCGIFSSRTVSCRSFSWHSSQKYYPDKDEFKYYCGVGIRLREKETMIFH